MSINGNLEAGTETKAIIDLFPMECSLCFLIATKDHLPRSGHTHSGLGLPRSGINQENSHRLAYSTIWWRQFLKESSLFPDDQSFCQVDEKLTSTPRNVNIWLSNLKFILVYESILLKIYKVFLLILLLFWCEIIKME